MINIDNIIIQKAYLLENKIEELKFSKENLLKAKYRVMQDAELMMDLDDYGKRSIAEAFTKKEKEKVCRMCQYQEVCLNN